MTQSTLEKTYYSCSDKIRLPPLDEMRTAIGRFYQNQGGKSKWFNFIGLGDVVEFRFIKKMFYVSDFMWPSVIGFCGILVSIFNLLNNGMRGLTIGNFHSDLVLILVLSLCLFLSAYPFMAKSFDCNMQERPPATSYFLRLMKLSAIFVISSLLFVSAFYYLGMISITFY
ncbi:hypothetical protein IBT49_14045 [Erwinia sp. S63]|uniref:hypothetical protein n=1 Tax=Erwinia sp. S63 TaxID=2769341 RepID=UPI00190C6BA1|nr:hypothetical protein [Erwinia sp. S63]MBK0097102.1 hypothetical protein [Erwinia sp. S63]